MSEEKSEILEILKPFIGIYFSKDWVEKIFGKVE